jgi:hypothetical protein
MMKWKLMLTTLPFVAGALAVRSGLDWGFQFGGVVEFSDVGLVLTAAVFLMGFMLAGVMSDFKEAEKLPAELACTLETLEDTVSMAAFAKPALNAQELRGRVLNVSETVWDWLMKKVDAEGLHKVLHTFEETLVDVEKAGAGGYATRGLNELHNLRKSLTRIQVISETSFLQSGYALLETLVVTAVGVVMVSKFKSGVAEYMLLSVVTLIYVYMLRLIRDLDDPFEYSENGAPGAAEADIFPLRNYLRRARARV